jgi:hypothetical protein
MCHFDDEAPFFFLSQGPFAGREAFQPRRVAGLQPTSIEMSHTSDLFHRSVELIPENLFDFQWIKTGNVMRQGGTIGARSLKKAVIPDLKAITKTGGILNAHETAR